MTIEHIERRLAIKSLDADGTFTGYASVFGKLDAQREIVTHGAFKRTLASWQAKGSAPAMLWMHDPTQPIGVWIAMGEDENGLCVQGKLALGTQKGMEAYELLRMKAVTGLSIGYRVVSSRIDAARKARILTEVDLFEISLVTFPANDAARVSAVKAPQTNPRPKPKQGKKVQASRGRKGAGSDSAKTRAVVARLNEAARKLKQDSVRR